VHRTLTEHPKEFQRTLRTWFLANRRPLPWRTALSLYRTVVSEFMLQQTQVKTVLPYFERWMRELPDFTALANAPETTVMKLWEGLGYYSRARNLHRLAKELVTMPAPPVDSAGWQMLPGVGPYTAAAISSIACGQPDACVDGNIVRVLARLTATRTSFRDNAAAVKHFAPLAASVLDRRHPGDHNEALMELGATVCTRASTACDRCPVSRFCAGFAASDPAAFPRIARRATEKREVSRAWCVHRGRLLLHRTSATSRRLTGLRELPETSTLGIKPTAKDLLLTKRRAITHHQITESIYSIALTPTLRKAIAKDPALEWVPLAHLERITLSGPHRRWIGGIIAAR